MAGVAEGAELPLEQIAVLNARYELAYLSSMSETQAGLTAEDQTDGCTAFAALPEVTHDGGTLLGQNWDWIADIRGRCFVMRVDRPDRPNFICMTQAGIVGGMIGLNESGLGLCVNGLISDEDGKNLQQRPFHMRVRDIMNSENMNQALKAVLSSDRNTSGNFLIGHADGEAIDLETAPQKANHILPTDGILTHANHFEVWNGINSVLELGGPSTLYRSQRLRRLLEQRNGPVDVDLAKRLFTDHFGHPYAICRHEGDDEPEGNKKLTVASVILSLNDRVMYASDGPPCENDYQRITLAA
jgi:isopenicillin-N N-acyltransferase-like protein